MKHLVLSDFAARLASSSPVPGGGGASALVGAVGVALGNMVGNLTTGKKKYAEVEQAILALNISAQQLRKELIELMEKDAEVFEPLSRAYSIPKDDPSRDEVMEVVLKQASEVPLEIMRKCCEAIEIIRMYAEIGSVIAVSDAGCGAAICKAALESAALNVLINTKSMKDRELAESMNDEVNTMLDKYCAMASEVYCSVSERLI